MRVLVTGISGLGGHLAPHLIAAGHDLIGLSREPERVVIDVPTVQSDAATGVGLEAAMQGVDVAYFLINTYEQSNTDGFTVRDRRVAQNFGAAARSAGVSRIVYLGVPPVPGTARPSEHTASRLEVEDILFDAVPESAAIRVLSIVSPRSRSFRALLQMLHTNPVVVLPPWRRNLTQPMDIRDVFACLVAAVTSDSAAGQRLSVGGPETMSWGTLIHRLVRTMGVRRLFLPLPIDAPRSIQRLVTVRNGGNPALVLPLMETLNSGDIVIDPNGADTLGVGLRPLERTLTDAVAELRDGSWKLTEGRPFEPVRAIK